MGLPLKIQEAKIWRPGMTIVEALVESGLCSSKSEAKRVIEQGGVKIYDTQIDEETPLLEELYNKPA